MFDIFGIVIYYLIFLEINENYVETRYVYPICVQIQTCIRSFFPMVFSLYFDWQINRLSRFIEILQNKSRVRPGRPVIGNDVISEFIGPSVQFN